MARITKPLTDREIKTAKPKEKKYKLSDGAGLFLLVTPQGGKQWKLKYRLNAKEREYSIGTYPTISLIEARQKRDELKNLVSKGIDPSQEKQKAKQEVKAQEIKESNTFRKVALEWHQSYKSAVTSERHYNDIISRLENHILPTLGDMLISDIKPLDIIAQMEIMKNKGISDTARRVTGYTNKIFKYAITYGYCENNPVAGIDTTIVLGKKETKHYPQIKDPKGVLNAIKHYGGDYATRKALQLLPYVSVRIGNLVFLRWDQVDFEKKEIHYDAEQMKIKKDFILPLSHQALEILQEVYKNRTSDTFVFPSPIKKNQSLSNGTINPAFRRMGYTKDEIVTHSFRNLFSTTCYEHQELHRKSSEVIEALLHHQEKNQVKKAYNRAEYAKPKQELIQWYADFIDENYR